MYDKIAAARRWWTQSVVPIASVDHHGLCRGAMDSSSRQ